jgi:methyl-accepting chemotaxis protein
MVVLDIDSLERSFDLVAGRGEDLVKLFYRRLFEVAPATRALFAGVDMATQRRALLAKLVALRNSLRNIEEIVPDLEELGTRHVAYGAEAAHYPVVGAVLIETMAEVGGADWTPEYTAAWTRAYQIVADSMIAGARRVERLPAGPP